MPQRVAVIRALPGIGDMLCVVPALAALRAGRPDARITLVGLPSGRWLAERRPDLIDEWMDLPSWPGMHDCSGDPAETLALLSSALPPFDLVVQLHGPGGPVNRLAQILSAGTTAVHVDRRTAGPERNHLVGRNRVIDRNHVINQNRVAPDRQWPRLVERSWPTAGHEVDRLRGLVTAIGSPDRGTRLDLPECPHDVDEATAVWRRVGDRPFVVVHPTARRPQHRWSPEGFASIVRDLAVDGWAVVVTGSGASREAVARVALRADVRVVPALDLPLGGLSAVLRRASAAVTSDMDVALLAQATGCPVSVIASSADVERWGPYGADVPHTVREPVGDLVADAGNVLADIRRVLRRAPGLSRVGHVMHRPSGRLASPR
jgi:ADP-heptose:LPS heptosyltransferase